ncbi:MAG: hypothetical protein GQ574_11820 [Crocinitomix sp.]|nr:hypothetical protein [Crocinitomix sp.]
MKKVKLNPDGDGYDSSPFFDEKQKERLKQHYSRIDGTLSYWKNHAEKYRRFKNYSIVWGITISIVIPVISQEIGDGNSNWFLTVISTHGALLIAFHKGFKVDQNYQAFRIAESEFFDLRRELLDNPTKFGATPEEQINDFILQVSRFRRAARLAEIDNAASINEIKRTVSNKT